MGSQGGAPVSGTLETDWKMRKSGHARYGRRASRCKVPVGLELGRKAGAGGEARGHSTESPGLRELIDSTCRRAQSLV